VISRGQELFEAFVVTNPLFKIGESLVDCKSGGTRVANMPSDKILAKSLGLLVGLGIAGIFVLRRAFRLAGKKDNGAFIEYFELLPPPPPPPPSAPLPLSGLTFAIKDM